MILSMENWGSVFSSVIDSGKRVSDKRIVLAKICQVAEKSNVSYSESCSVFEKCLEVIKVCDKPNLPETSLYGFIYWGNFHRKHLQQFITLEVISDVFTGSIDENATVVLIWLKDCLKILSLEDDQYILAFCTTLQDILQSHLHEHGAALRYLRQLAELHILFPFLLPPQNLRLSFTLMLMNCIASCPAQTEFEDIKHMNAVGELIVTLWDTFSTNDLYQVLKALYDIISNTDESVEVCPAIAHILSLIPSGIVSFVGPRILDSPATSHANVITMLNRLTLWLIKWPTVQSKLKVWIETVVMLLYKNNCIMVPAKVTMDRVSVLLNACRIPVVRPGVIDVVCCLLLSFQHSSEAFFMFAPELANTILMLEGEASDKSEPALSSLVNLSHALITMHLPLTESCDKLLNVLQRYPKPAESVIEKLILLHRYERGLDKKVVAPGSSSSMSVICDYKQREFGQKAGLRNLGNTCYMNSILQALFMTDEFRHSVLLSPEKTGQQLLMKLQHLFAQLCFSHRSFISPRTFYDMSRAPWFNPGMQQDCSEYLRHLLSTVHEEEKACQGLPEYQERVIIESETASIASDFQPLPEDCVEEFMTSGALSPLRTESTGDSVININSLKNSEPSCEPSDRTTYSAVKRIPNRNASDSYGYDGQNLLMGRESFVQVVNASLNKETQGVNCVSKSNKRKHMLAPENIPLQHTKTPKGDETVVSDVESNSDSGISGDLAEDAEIPFSNSGLNSPPSVLDDGILGFKAQFEVNSSTEYFTSLIHKIFGGKLSTSIHCLHCNTVSVHKDIFTDIHLTFKDSDRCMSTHAIQRQYDKLPDNEQNRPVEHLKIDDMICSFLIPEKLCDDNEYFCEKCDAKREAVRSIKILESPEHLILTQLRFFYDTTKNQRQKLFTNVEFKEDLSLPINSTHLSTITNISDASAGCNTVTSDAVREPQDCILLPTEEEGEMIHYALYAVVVHSGFSPEGGHYYCYGRSSDLACLPSEARRKLGSLGEWFNFNDEAVTKTTFSAIQNLTNQFSRDTAYVLFYKKVSHEDSKPLHFFEDFNSLHGTLREYIESDNLQYLNEQRRTSLRHSHVSSSSFNDKDDPPSGGCGDGGMSFNSPTRFIC